MNILDAKNSLYLQIHLHKIVSSYFKMVANVHRSVRPWIIVVWGEGGPVVSLHDDLRFWD